VSAPTVKGTGTSQDGLRRASDGFLKIRSVSKHFGALKAVDEVSFEVQEGQIFSVIGPNGAGKTTLFNVMTGIYPATGGQVTFLGQDILGLPPHQITDLGLARTYQIVRVFDNMSVLENVQVGFHCRTKAGVWDAIFSTQRAKEEKIRSRERGLELLERVGLQGHAQELARSLPLGSRKRLQVARALATEPRALLLDEPTAGMNRSEKQEMMALVNDVRDAGVTVLLVEHDMNVIMGISDWIVVLDYGVKIAEGTPEEIQNIETVIEAYLGRGLAHESVGG